MPIALRCDCIGNLASLQSISLQATSLASVWPKCCLLSRLIDGCTLPSLPPQADIPAALPSTTRFDFAQCQFALHYAFDSEAHVRRALENVTARLNPGGYFVGTTTDSRTIMCVLCNSRFSLCPSKVGKN